MNSETNNTSFERPDKKLLESGKNWGLHKCRKELYTSKESFFTGRLKADLKLGEFLPWNTLDKF